MRSGLQNLIKADNEADQLKDIYELYRRIHALTGNAGLAGFVYVSQMSAAVEALLKELHEKPKSINTSTLRTVAAAVDFLGSSSNAARSRTIRTRRPSTFSSWTTSRFPAAP